MQFKGISLELANFASKCVKRDFRFDEGNGIVFILYKQAIADTPFRELDTSLTTKFTVFISDTYALMTWMMMNSLSIRETRSTNYFSR